MWRILTRTTWGLFLLAVTSYLASPKLLGIKPLNAPQLLEWFGNLPDASQALIASSVLTTVGFLAAFSSKYAALRRQAADALAVEAANSIFDQFTKANRCVIELDGYLEFLQNAIALARNQPDNPQSVQLLLIANQRAGDFLGATARLHEANLSLHEVTIRSSALISNFGLSDHVQRGRKLFDKAANGCRFTPPCADTGQATFIADFLSQVDDAAIQSARAEIYRASQEGGAVFGYVQANLRARTISQNFIGMLHTSREVWRNPPALASIFMPRKTGIKAD